MRGTVNLIIFSFHIGFAKVGVHLRNPPIMIKSLSDLEVYKLSYKLAIDIFTLTKSFPSYFLLPKSPQHRHIPLNRRSIT